MNRTITALSTAAVLAFPAFASAGGDTVARQEAAAFLGAIRDGEQRGPGLEEMRATAESVAEQLAALVATRVSSTVPVAPALKVTIRAS